jgi:hypothetical protein
MLPRYPKDVRNKFATFPELLFIANQKGPAAKAQVLQKHHHELLK